MTVINDRFGEITDVIGVGIGPFNLSLAALLEPLKTIKYHFFDQNEQFSWHPGMLLPGSEIQVSHLKDLVTLADPANPYSFLSFLAKNKRLYRFINARFPRVQRSEFNQYLKWASESLTNLHFREKVERIEYAQDSKLFLMQTTRRMIKSKHLILGNGLAAHIPSVAKPFLGDHVFHCKDFLFKKQNCAGKRVLVIGGGQSGAEIINALLSDGISLPSKLTWVTRRKQFSPIDDSPGANELFSPNHSEAFYQLPFDKKADLLNQHLLASDGISQYLLESIYQKLYTLEFLEGRGRIYDLLPNHSLSKIHQTNAQFSLTLVNNEFAMPRSVDADIIVLCTGYQNYLPAYLTPLMDHVPLHNGKFIINPDYSIAWDGPNENRIYVQNAARHSHGIADPNLSLMAYRSAKIINSITENNTYDLDCVSDSINWSDIYSTTYTSPENNAYVERYY
jgi:lysine N6-hydroxylase